MLKKQDEQVKQKQEKEQLQSEIDRLRKELQQALHNNKTQSVRPAATPSFDNEEMRGPDVIWTRRILAFLVASQLEAPRSWVASQVTTILFK